jgi:hypothetical protein
LKIERRGDSCFISHNGLTIFFNKFQDKKTHELVFNIRVNAADYEQGSGLVKKWRSVGEMHVDRAGFDKLCTTMNQLVFKE